MKLYTLVKTDDPEWPYRAGSPFTGNTWEYPSGERYESESTNLIVFISTRGSFLWARGFHFQRSPTVQKITVDWTETTTDILMLHSALFQILTSVRGIFARTEQLVPTSSEITIARAQLDGGEKTAIEVRCFAVWEHIPKESTLFESCLIQGRNY